MYEGWGQGAKARRIRFRCRTQDHWLEGYVDTVSRRLVDFLNSDAAREVANACEVSVSTGSGSKQDYITLRDVEISTSKILFAFPIENKPSRPDFSIRSTLRKERVVLGVGAYEIQGDVYLPRTSKGVLNANPRRFLVVAKATLMRTDKPDSLELHDAICVNREHVEFIGSVSPDMLVGFTRAEVDRRQAEETDRITASLMVAVERAKVLGPGR